MNEDINANLKSICSNNTLFQLDDSEIFILNLIYGVDRFKFNHIIENNK